MKIGWVVVVASVVAGLGLGLGACSKSGGGSGSNAGAAPQRPAAGHERGDCRSDKSCDPGLLCLSNLCVRPPPADCQPIADQLASMELGNYAEPEVRAPIVANYKAACDKAYVSKEEGACIAAAHTKQDAATCAPRMFPELASSGTGDCPTVVQKIRSTMMSQVGATLDPSMQQTYERILKAAQESCVTDAWPDALKKCVLDAMGGIDAMSQCNAKTPPALQQKIQQRLMQAMNGP